MTPKPSAEQAPGADPVYESDEQFIARLGRIGRDYRYSDEFIGLVVRRRFPREWPWPGKDTERGAGS